MANVLNDYFVTVFTEENISEVLQVEFGFISAESVLQDVITPDDRVMVKLGSLRWDKATTVDDISPRLILQTRSEICYLLVIIIQKTLQLGEVPHDWKQLTLLCLQ